MNTIRQLCDRCVVLNQGKVIFVGDVEKAIELYLQNTNDGYTPFTALETRDRPQNSTNRARMHNVEFIDKEESVAVRGEQLKIKLRWQAKDKLEDVKFRMIIRYRDDTPVGLVQSDIIASVCAGEQRETVFSLDTSMLADGKYFFSIALFQSDDIGNSVILDHVTRACGIEIISPLEGERLLNWEHRWWGSVRFPNLEILN